MKSDWKKLKIADVLLAVLLLFLAALIYVLNSQDDNGSIVEIIHGKSFYRYSLFKKRIISLNTQNGVYKIRINGKKVSIIETKCRFKTCKKMGPIAKPGESMICIPNRIVVRIKGSLKKVDVICH